jgi:hypothetical protein
MRAGRWRQTRADLPRPPALKPRLLYVIYHVELEGDFSTMSRNLPTRRKVDDLPSTVAALAEIPEEEIWLQKQKSARRRRAYRLDVQHFLRTLGIASQAEPRQADHKAVIAWERFLRETEGAAP